MLDHQEFSIVLRLPTISPDARMTVRVAPNWQDGKDISCTYDPDQLQWQVSLLVPQPQVDVTLKFLYEGRWQIGENLVIAADDLTRGVHVFDDRSVSFGNDGRLTVDVPLPARMIFDETGPEPSTEFDVIVIGSGAGGGALAYALTTRPASGAQSAKRVLVLEAGSYLFPTHVGNLPRREPAGPTPETHIWDLWYDYRIMRWTGPDGAPNSAEVSQALNLGGRTIFWGALAPRAKDWELRTWPERVAEELHNTWYEEAEQLMRVRQLAASAYQVDVRMTLRGLPQLAGFSHVDAPMATEYVGRAPDVVPAGVFSTAELLIERELQRDTNGDPLYPNLQVRLNHEVTEVELSGEEPLERAVGVVTYDHRQDRPRRFTISPGGAVVLCAGTLGSPLLARASGVPDPNVLVGRGLTDHPIYVVPFWISRVSKWFRDTQSSIVLSRPLPSSGQDRGDGRPSYPYNVKLSLNTRLTQSRFVEPEEFFQLMDEDRMPCELVFMLESPLLEENRVEPTPGHPNQPQVVTMDAQHVEPALKAAMDHYADVVLAAFNGEPGIRHYASLGGVGHEVGTMRMVSNGDGGVAAGVVDEHLLVIGTDNLYTCDLSVFPSSPAANPTLTLVALALRLAAELHPN